MQLTPVATIAPTTVAAGFGVLAGALSAPIRKADDSPLIAALRAADERSKR